MRKKGIKSKVIQFLSAVLLLSMVSGDMSCSRRSGRGRGDVRQSVRKERREMSKRSTGMTIVKMRHVNGVYYIPCKINGVEMEFIFDTGASDITMSLTEAMFLYKQGRLTDADILGSSTYQIADGSVTDGAIINLRSVTIGSVTLHNVKASVMSNMDAPLLLGQSALSRFGKLSIDYNRGEITFE